MRELREIQFAVRYIRDVCWTEWVYDSERKVIYSRLSQAKLTSVKAHTATIIERLSAMNTFLSYLTSKEVDIKQIINFNLFQNNRDESTSLSCELSGKNIISSLINAGYLYALNNELRILLRTLLLTPDNLLYVDGLEMHHIRERIFGDNNLLTDINASVYISSDNVLVEKLISTTDMLATEMGIRISLSKPSSWYTDWKNLVFIKIEVNDIQKFLSYLSKNAHLYQNNLRVDLEGMATNHFARGLSLLTSLGVDYDADKKLHSVYVPEQFEWFSESNEKMTEYFRQCIADNIKVSSDNYERVTKYTQSKGRVFHITVPEPKNYLEILGDLNNKIQAFRQAVEHDLDVNPGRAPFALLGSTSPKPAAATVEKSEIASSEKQASEVSGQQNVKSPTGP